MNQGCDTINHIASRNLQPTIHIADTSVKTQELLSRKHKTSNNVKKV